VLLRLLYRRGPRIALALLLVVAIILCFVPLLDVLGFERAFVSGLFCAPIGAALAVAAKRALPERTVTDRALTALWLGLIALIPTAACGALVEALTASCSPGQGLAFLLVGAGTQTAVGVALGTVAVETPVPPGWAVALALVASLGFALARLWEHPQIDAFNLPFGYWPGSLYDEGIDLGAAFIAHRTLALFTAIAVVALVHAKHDRRALFAVLFAGGIAGLLWSKGEALGFDRTRATVERTLSREVETDRWVLHVDPAIGESRLARMKLELTLRDAQLERFFGKKPSHKLIVYLYADDDQKKALMGAHGTQLARPWQHELHISGFDVPHPSLKHELAHLYGGEIAAGPLGVPARALVLVNLGLVEGLAVAADWPVRGGLTVHEWARAMRALKLAPDPRDVIYPAGFWSQSSSRAYTIAGSFIRWLADTKGIEPLARAYASNDFEGAYGAPMATLVEGWAQMIDAMPLSETDRLQAEYRFKSPSIFARVCPHTTANLLEDARDDMARGDLDRALDALDRAFGYDPSRVDVLYTGAKALGRAGRMEEARAWATRGRDAPGSTTRGMAMGIELLADLAWQQSEAREDARIGARDAARSGYEEVRSLGLSEESARLQTVKLQALTRPSTVSEPLRKYLSGALGSDQSAGTLGALARGAPHDPIVAYLFGKLLENVLLPELAVTEASRAIALGLDDPALVREATSVTARSLLWSGKAAESRAAFEGLARNSTRAGGSLDTADWVERAGTVLE